MPSDYQAITDYNKRQLGEDTASRKTQINMYSDSTHFIYEILQNADDYGATEVLFKLFKDQLIIEHNGEPFKEVNVKAITYFGKSTSRDDLVKTGRFGVGFKSVFAFTATPIVISENEHFQIYDLYCVREYPYPTDISCSMTRIILPFNHESEKPDYVENIMLKGEAFSKISKRLTSLNMNTLLFTRNILEIHWEIDGHSGHYLREDDTNDKARWTTITDGDRLNKYLVFSRIPEWESKKYKPVEIAFAIDDKNILQPIEDFLYVLFATTQETHLKFVLNGPYRTNPSRETISDEDQFNRHLMNEICALMKDVLLTLRQMDLMTTQFLSVLPNSTDNLRDFYKPLHKSIIKTFHEYELVPTDDNQFATASNLFQGPAQLREVIRKQELQFFTGREYASWVKGVQQNSRADYFIRDLDIKYWGWSELEQVLRNKFITIYYQNDDDDNIWLKARSDSWLQELYMLLADALKKTECSEYTLKRCQIIRVLEDGKENHVTASKAYFPKRGYSDLPQIKHSILRGRNQKETEKIEESLITLGVTEIGEEERINSILETIYNESSASISSKQHLQHMRLFIKHWKKNKDSVKFDDDLIFRGSGINTYHKGEDCYIDSPIRKSGLIIIYSTNHPNLPKKVRLWNDYKELVKDGFCEFAISSGVSDNLAIKHRYCSEHPMWLQLKKGLTSVRQTKLQIDNDYYIPNLSELLKLENREINLLIWNAVRQADPEVLEAVYRPNQQYSPRTEKSSLILELSKVRWIPNKNGQLYHPSDITKEQLHKDFKYDNRNGWLDEIGFEENVKKATEEYRIRDQEAKNIGFSSVEEAKKMAELAILMKERGKSPDELIKEFSMDVVLNKKPKFPSKVSLNRGRRDEKIGEQFIDATEKDYEKRNRSVRTSKVTIDQGSWLRNLYTNSEKQMVCQICKQEMPFKKRNGEYYFESIEALSRNYFTKELEAQYLALCPVCAAMFREFVINVEGVQKAFKNALLNSKEPEVAIKLGDKKTSVKFVDTHFYDLQAILVHLR